ncbi:MAG TPA: short-chain dehydrogenase [Prolixibacteraceae bacterium]|jgi:NAD(P)-dependent dehydrogenase (short-subunit alcohol dehydrogenase family)|nr:short-chain dehydrogenase [Prolixibacteraceae bacterium]
MNDKPTPTILVTGANRGIGFEIARQLLKKGAHVIISGRDELKLAEALKQLERESSSAEMVVMDVGKFESVKAASQQLAERNIQLDVVINNAAILLREDVSLIGHDDEVLKTTININCYGPVRVIHAFLPLMKSPGRIINLSSEGGSMSEPVGGWSPAYCVSKTMLNSITRHIAFELSAKHISVNAISPGWVKTTMGGQSAPRSIEKGAEGPVWLATEAPQSMTGKFFRDKAELKW